MKTLALLAARGGAVDALVEAVRGQAKRVADALPDGASVQVLRRIDDDPLARFQPPVRPFEVALEVVVGDPADEGDGCERALAALEGLGAALQEHLHPDLSQVAAGSVDSVSPPAPHTPYRYLYLMRRKLGTTHAQYLDHYVNVHAEFGRRTPAITGYEQFHLDEATSRAMGQQAGLVGCLADSVSELSIPDVDAFMQGVATSPVSAEGPRDEINFVDRGNSIGCMMEELERRVVGGS